MTDTLSTIVNAPKIDAILAKENINGFEAPGGTDKQTIHSYGPVYEQLLDKLNQLTKQSFILEVGVQLGGSLLLWHELCPQSYVIGVDVQDIVHPSIFSRMKAERHSFIMGDAYGNEMIALIKTIAPNGLDFVIDDGPHSLDSQQCFLRQYLPLLAPSGVAIIEDIQAPEWYDSLLPLVGENFAFEKVDRRGIKGRYDDLMLVISR